MSNRSEIFESFVKIAQEQGVISDDAEHTEKDFHETNPRHDSLTIEQIGKLYNTKPAMPKDMEYKKNIMEDAHPDPVVLFMAHDKLNALIENENEGQNARIRITLKEPDGHLTQRKYAEKELVLSLVRLANSLDNNGQEELCKLADACLVQATTKKKVLTKRAVAPLLIIGAVVAVVGVIYAKEHLPTHALGWTQDYDKADQAIDAMLNATQSFGFGYTYKQELLSQLTQLKSVLADINTAVQNVQPALDEVETPRTGPGITEELAKLSKDPATIKADQAVKDLRSAMVKNLPFVKRVISNFGNESYKQRMISDEGTFTSWIDATEILHGGKGLITDKFDDVADALNVLRGDLVNLVKTLKGITNVQQQLQQQLAGAQQETDLDFKDEQKPSETPTAPAETGKTPAPAGHGGGALEALEKEFGSFLGG
jgi:hypothetical protein